MKRRLLMVLLAIGTLGGYAAGFASVHHHRMHHADRAGWCDHEARDDSR